MNSEEYCSVLEHRLMPWAAETFGEQSSSLFQQDSAAVHRSIYTSNWLREQGAYTLQWPAQSPDLIILENVGGS